MGALWSANSIPTQEVVLLSQQSRCIHGRGGTEPFTLWPALLHPFLLSKRQAVLAIRPGVCLLPVFLSLIPASVVAGAVITRINHFRWACWSGWFLTTLGSGLTIIWEVDTSIVAWVFILFILGIGQGLLLDAQNFATQAIAKPKDEANAAAIYAFIRSFSMVLGVGIGSSGP